MKKTSLISIIFVLIFGVFGEVFAYSTNQFSIDIPDNYIKVTTNSFTNENGNNINIQIGSFSNTGKGELYTEENLNELVDEIYKNLEDQKENLKIEMKNQYGAYYTDEQISEYVNSFKCNYIDTKEITTFGKENYKCFHIVGNFTMSDLTYFSSQYTVASGNNIYTLTISGDNKEFFETDEVKNIVSSFSINNFKEVKGKMSDTMQSVIIIIGCAIIGGVIGVITRKRNKDNKTAKDE